MRPWQTWQRWWERLDDEQSVFLEQLPPARVRWAVLLASAAALYTEMVIVRWHSTCFHAFAIFKNVSLLSCFLGLGIGFGMSSRRQVALPRFLPLLTMQTLLFGVLSCTNLGGRIVNPVAEQLVMGSAGGAWSWLHAVEGNVFLLTVFIINAWMFIPLGHLTGRLMGRLPRVQSYSLNLLGSLVGIGVFFVLSLLWSGPEVWMGIAVLALAPFLWGRRLAMLGVSCVAMMLLALGVIAATKGLTYYSPYQVITYQLPEPGKSRLFPTIRVNHCYYQEIFDASAAAAASNPRSAGAALYYGLPYRLQQQPGDVLVVGAGTGNDVAAALRHGARSVTAVELDPAILMLGRKAHPEHPYQDARTHAVVNDARTFVRQTGERFDTIVYGLLDSHTNLGAMTNVRVDSFVYTVEGFREAMGRLRDDGLVLVSYTLLDPGQGKKLFAMLREAYPDLPPRAFCIRGAQHDGGTTFAAGPGLKNVPPEVPGVTEVTDEFAGGVDAFELATDDWPFFYMKARTYPYSYLVMIALLLAVSALMIRRHLGGERLLSSLRGVFFFLGAGFMLIETKGITELGLAFGNTWSVVAIVVASILLMGFAANQWVLRAGPASGKWAYSLLFMSLALGWGVTYLSLTGIAIPGAIFVLPVALTLPLLFAGLIFSSALAVADDIGSALSANIFGAMLGGFMEYNSMYWGYTSLYPLGIVLYGLAFVCHGRAAAVAQATPEAELPLAA
jgi:SAM-dependent methyltransferase